MSKINIAFEIGRAADDAITMGIERQIIEGESTAYFEEWGKKILELLRKRGIYVKQMVGITHNEL